MREGAQPLERGAIKRFFWLVAFFLAFLSLGIIALRVTGGGTGSAVHDAYRLVAMFALNGEWAFAPGLNPILPVLAFVAPLATVLGIVELLGRSIFSRIQRDLKLLRMRGHVVVLGLNKESLLLMEGIKNGPNPPDVVVVADNLGDDERSALLSLGAVLIDRSGNDQSALAAALLERADVLISFMQETDQSLSILSSVDSYLRRKDRMRGRDPLDFWIKIDNPKLGERLAEYFGLTDVQERLHPRFFSLEETSARRLWRRHALDAYAEAQGHGTVHLAVYGFDRLASQVMTEAIRQTLPSPSHKMVITILTDDPKETESRLRAWRPGMFSCADIRFVHLPFHVTGISDADYAKLPRGVTAHVVCHKDPDAAAATALSLRRLLLTKPAGAHPDEPRRVNAPVLVRFDRPTGIGQLLSGSRSSRDKQGSSWPDGVEVFGGYDEMLKEDMRDAMEPTVIDTAREAIARHIHLSYQIGVAEAAQLFADSLTPTTEAEKKAERSWQVLAPEFRDSCRHAADHLWTKARALRGRVVASDAHRTLTLDEDDAARLTALEHSRWVNERLLSGWSYAEKRVDAAKQHPQLVPYEDLPLEARVIDQTLIVRMDSALSAGHLEIRRHHIVGITGHRHLKGRPLDTAFVRQSLEAELQTIIREHPDEQVILLTPLATGADSLAADAALACGIPYTAVLPLPFEASRSDYEKAPGGIRAFLNYVAQAERVIELPLRFGCLRDVTPDRDGHSTARDQQYALAGGYLVRRCHTLLAVWDGQPSRGLGGTAEIVAWARKGKVPEEYALEGPFAPPPVKPKVVIIAPTAI